MASFAWSVEGTWRTQPRPPMPRETGSEHASRMSQKSTHRHICPSQNFNLTFNPPRTATMEQCPNQSCGSEREHKGTSFSYPGNISILLLSPAKSTKNIASETEREAFPQFMGAANPRRAFPSLRSRGFPLANQYSMVVQHP